MICNADESEPGTFKDRQILAEQPHLVLEGMLLGMLAVGRGGGLGVHPARVRPGGGGDPPGDRVAARRRAGRRGRRPAPGRRLSVEVFTSPGGYILGEESALIECMEGHRGEPRNKPPFPGIYGLWGQPTLMNSVETFAHVPVILGRGAGWWQEQGAGDSTGLKFFAVSGHVERPGVYCVPMGTTARAAAGAGRRGVRAAGALGAIQPGGASSNFLGPGPARRAARLRRPRARPASMLGSGAMVVMAEGTDLLAAATNVLRFFRDESCGKCVPVPGRLQPRPTGYSPTCWPRAAGPPTWTGRSPSWSRSCAGPRSAGSARWRWARWTCTRHPAERSGADRRLTPTRCAGGREFFTTRTVGRGAGRVPAGPAHAGRDGAARRRPCTGCRPQPVTAPHALPGFARSTVDGYAVRAADTYGVSEGLPGYLEVAGAVRMGAEPDVTVGPGTAASMPTGGVLPPGADAVVMIEYTQEAMPGTIEVVRPVAPGDGVVRADEDAAAGAELVPAGRPLRAQDLGMLAAAGVTDVAVHARPRVTVFSTGDEVVPPDTAALRPGPGARRVPRSRWPGWWPRRAASRSRAASCPTTPTPWSGPCGPRSAAAT